MNFFSKAIPPIDSHLLSQISSAFDRLIEKLIKIDLKALGISEYNQMYLSKKISNPTSYLQLYSYLLALSLAGNRRPLNEFSFVDYGGGSGFLSLLAKELGIGNVIYNDIYEVSCRDVKALSIAISSNINEYVCGDIDDLIKFVNKQTISINAICSYDVIEHIYNIESYLRKLPLLSTNSLRIVFGSGANIKNPRTRRVLRKTHLRCEYQDRVKKWGHKERDTLRGYLAARKEIVNHYSPEADRNTIDEIAKSTRGLMKQDIEKCVDEYRKTGEISYKPDHPSNTCDPYTGNWAEHLMDTEWLESILKEEGFEVKILSGYWPYSKNIYKRMIKNLLNLGIKNIGKAGLFISPYYVLYADYDVKE